MLNQPHQPQPPTTATIKRAQRKNPALRKQSQAPGLVGVKCWSRRPLAEAHRLNRSVPPRDWHKRLARLWTDHLLWTIRRCWCRGSKSSQKYSQAIEITSPRFLHQKRGFIAVSAQDTPWRLSVAYPKSVILTLVPEPANRAAAARVSGRSTPSGGSHRCRPAARTPGERSA